MYKNIKYFLSLTLFIFSLLCSAQQNKTSGEQSQMIDSLYAVIKKLKTTSSKEFAPTIAGEGVGAGIDTTLIITLNTLAWEFKNNNPDTAILYSTQALNLSLTIFKSEEINSPLGKVREWCVAKSYGNLGTFNYLKANYSVSLGYYSKALKIWESLNDKKGIATVLGNMGNDYNGQGDYSQALGSHFKALKISEEIGDKSGIARHLGNIGNVYHNQGDYPKTLDYYLKALKMKEELGDKNGIAITINNIGLLYFKESEYTKALECFLKALKIDEELGNKNGAGIDFGNIGNVYNDQAIIAESRQNIVGSDSLYKQALDYYSRALKIAEELGNKYLAANWRGNMGIIYCQKGDYQKASDCFVGALKMSEEIGDKSGIGHQFSNLGSLYTTMKKYAQAEEYYRKALVISTELRTLNSVKQEEKALSELYEKTHQPDKAVEHYKKYIAAKDSIFNQENTKRMVRSEMNFEFDKKQAIEKAEQEKQNAIAQQEKQKRKTILIFVSFLLILVVVFSAVMFSRWRLTQKQKYLIEEHTKEIEDEKKKVEQANVLITKQNKMVEEQKKIVEDKNRNITDSIDYAKTIQLATLPSEELRQQLFPASFVLFKPKDIVSGDFYWYAEKNGKKIIAACDCTGHGVPGALMSMIGNNILNQIINENGITSPNEILNSLHREIRKVLKQEEQNDTKDGMDIAVITFNNETEIEFASAHRPLWMIKETNDDLMESLKAINADMKETSSLSSSAMPLSLIKEIKGNKFAIGGRQMEDERKFIGHKLSLNKGDSIYIFSDGFADQFSENNEKLMTSGFKEILLSVQQKSMPDQKILLNDFVERWKGSREQIDDILVIGIRV
jgi:tetratricopeptide (TPR) repeat protein